MQKLIPTPTVGEILLEEFMQPLSLSMSALTKETGISESTMKGIVEGEVKVTPEISQRLSFYFGMSELFFYRLQLKIDARNVEREVKYA